MTRHTFRPLGRFTACCLAIAAALAPEATAQPVVTQILPATSAATVLGRAVFDRAGTNVGLLVDIAVDNNGHPVAGVIDAGGFLGLGGRRIAVAWRLLRVVRDGADIRITMDLTFDFAAAGPEFHGPDDTTIVIDRPEP